MQPVGACAPSGAPGRQLCAHPNSRKFLIPQGTKRHPARSSHVLASLSEGRPRPAAKGEFQPELLPPIRQLTQPSVGITCPAPHHPFEDPPCRTSPPRKSQRTAAPRGQ